MLLTLIMLIYGCIGGFLMALLAESRELGWKLALLLSPLWVVVFALEFIRQVWEGLHEHQHYNLAPWFRPLARWWQRNWPKAN